MVILHAVACGVDKILIMCAQCSKVIEFILMSWPMNFVYYTAHNESLLVAVMDCILVAVAVVVDCLWLY